MKDFLKYRGHTGSIDVSPEDDCLFGKLMFIKALVSYEGGTISELERAFKNAVDDYLNTQQAPQVSPSFTRTHQP